MMLERTRQQLDPVGSADTRRVWETIAVAALAYAAVRTISDWSLFEHPLFALLSLALTAGAIGLVIVWTVPTRAPFTRAHHLTIHLVVLASMAASVWSRPDGGFEVHGDPAPLVLGVLIVAMSPYRPAQEIAALGLVSATIAGFLVLVEVSAADTVLPALVYVLPSVTPIMALAIGAAVYTDGLVRAIEEAGASVGAQTLATVVDDGAVRHDRVTILTGEALPLLQGILDSGMVTARSRTEAARVAQSLRSMLVAEADLTWLVSSQIHREGPRFHIEDEHGLASHMLPTQRTVFRAMLEAFLGDPTFVSGSVRIENGNGFANATVEVQFEEQTQGSAPRHPVVSAMLSILRTVFSGLESTRESSRVLVTFGYEFR